MLTEVLAIFRLKRSQNPRSPWLRTPQRPRLLPNRSLNGNQNPRRRRPKRRLKTKTSLKKISRMRAIRPETHLVTVPGAGHDLHLEQPEAWLQTLDEFLR